MQRTTERSTGHGVVAVVSTLFVVIVAVPIPARAVTFSNPTAITIPEAGLFSPYPSRIEVSGLAGSITDVNVRLRGVNHTFPSDIDVVLVGPPGIGYVVLMADAVASGELIFDASAAASLPCPGNVPINSGTFRPTNCDSYSIDPALTNTALSIFNGKSANGTWELYGGDDDARDSGEIASGWSLEISTGPTISTFAPTSGPPGTSVAIEGTSLTGATSVAFGGVAATTFTVASDTLATATVPAGAATGPITVTTPNGTATSATSFTVGTGSSAEHAREVSLRLTRGTARGAVTVGDGFTGCADDVRVKVQRRQQGGWRAVGSDSTSAGGRFLVPVREPGTYRAIAKRSELASGDICLKDVSPPVKLRA